VFTVLWRSPRNVREREDVADVLLIARGTYGASERQRSAPRERMRGAEAPSE
jgi:hypothetical protein